MQRCFRYLIYILFFFLILLKVALKKRLSETSSKLQRKYGYGWRAKSYFYCFNRFLFCESLWIWHDLIRYMSIHMICNSLDFFSKRFLRLLQKISDGQSVSCRVALLLQKLFVLQLWLSERTNDLDNNKFL